jgi:mono/diheme cytochrome c family protein
MAGHASRLRLGIVGVVGLLGSAAAWAGDAETGHQLARRWCAACHLVDAEASTPRTGEARPFPTLANDARWPPKRLRAFLMMPHPPMPPVNLSSFDIDDLVAHILSLRTSRNGSAEDQHGNIKSTKHRRKRRVPGIRFAADDDHRSRQVLQAAAVDKPVFRGHRKLNPQPLCQALSPGADRRR